MAKFCKYCGTQLEDGQVCGCPQAQAEAAAQQPVQPQQPQQQPPQQQYAQPQPEQPPQQQYAQPQQQPYQQPAPAAPRAPSPVGIAFKNLGPFLKAYFQSPVNAARTAVQQGDMILSIILLSIQAIVVGLMMFPLALTRFGFRGVLGSFGRGLPGGVSIALSFFISLFLGILLAAICVMILTLLIFAMAKIMKSACSFKDILIGCGAHSVFVTALYVLAFLFFFVHMQAGMLFLTAAALTWVVLSVSVIQELIPSTEKGTFWLCTIAVVLITYLVGYWLGSFCANLPVTVVRLQSFPRPSGGLNGASNIIENIFDLF